MPPQANPWAFDFFEKIFSNSSVYVGSLDGQMLHWLVLQKVSNPPPTMNYFPRCQTINSNVKILQNTTEISEVSESPLTEVCSFQ